MRLLECVLLIASILGWVHLIWSVPRRYPEISHVIIGIILGVLLLHATMEHLRWTMLPAYSMAAVAIGGNIYRIFRKRETHKLSRLKSLLLSFLALIMSIVSWALPNMLPMFQFAKPGGPYAVGVVDHTWSDPARTLADGTPRRLNVRIWYPSNGQHTTPAGYIPQPDLFIDAIQQRYGLWSKLLDDYRELKIPADYAAPFQPTASPAPVVVYLHGNHLGTRFTGTFQAIELASHGYVVVALEHPGTAFISPFAKGEYAMFTNYFSDLPDTFSAHNKASIPIIREQQADIEWILARLRAINHYEPDSPLVSNMDDSRVALIGHSFGGAIAANMLNNSASIKAAVNFDGYLYGEYPSSIQATKPLLILNGTYPIKGLEETMSGLEVERQLRKQLLGSSGLEINLPKAGHLSFTDLPLYSPLLALLAPDIKEQHHLINEQVLQFLQSHL